MQKLPQHPKNVREKAERFVRWGNPDYHQIEVAAYYRAQRRGFAPDHELDDWLEAEREFNSLTAS